MRYICTKYEQIHKSQKLLHMVQTDLKLNSTNPEAITYATEELGITILGGVRLEGLDRMRVTLKIEIINRKFEHYLNNPDIANLALRHNLDFLPEQVSHPLIFHRR